VSVHAEPAATRPRVREITGPSALGGGWRRFLHLTWLIATTDYRLTYFGSVLGYLWSLMRPLLLFGVLYVVFHEFLRFGEDIPRYADLLLLNIVLFTFFGEATSNSVRAVLDREALVRKMHFPRLVIPLAVVLTSMFNLAANLVAVFVFFLIDGIEPRWFWLLTPLLLIPLWMFTAAVAMILSSLYVSYRDVQPIWIVFSQLLFYATPILYVVDKVPANLHVLVMSNPLACVLEQARRWYVDPDAPGSVSAIGGFPQAFIPAAIFVAVCVAGVWIFTREAPRIAERL
jgi:ABC-2 type transport system permease protein